MISELYTKLNYDKALVQYIYTKTAEDGWKRIYNIYQWKDKEIRAEDIVYRIMYSYPKRPDLVYAYCKYITDLPIMRKALLKSKAKDVAMWHIAYCSEIDERPEFIQKILETNDIKIIMNLCKRIDNDEVIRFVAEHGRPIDKLFLYHIKVLPDDIDNQLMEELSNYPVTLFFDYCDLDECDGEYVLMLNDGTEDLNYDI